MLGQATERLGTLAKEFELDVLSNKKAPWALKQKKWVL